MSAHINLLDWRGERRTRRKQQFLAMLGIGAGASAAAVLIGLFLMKGALANQQDRNAYLTQQIAEMDLKIKEIEDLERVKSNLLARMQVIEELQASRTASVHFFDEIVNTLPEGVTLSSIKQKGTQVTLTGVAESNGRVSTYMKNLDDSEWFADPKLVIIKTTEKSGQRTAEFTLQVKNLTKAQPNPDGSAATGGATP